MYHELVPNVETAIPARHQGRAVVVFTAWVILFVAALPGFSQVWQTQITNPTADYFLPSYPVAFVAAKVRETVSQGVITGDYHIGTDVLSANNPSGGHELWILLPNGNPVKLFPYPEHFTAGLIDHANLSDGSVVEPNISEDGQRIYFSYFHDAETKISPTNLPVKGADLYCLDLGPLLANYSYDPRNLNVYRLTQRTYLSGGVQDPNDWQRTAMNWSFAQDPEANDFGTVFMHAIEMRKQGKLKLVYVSDERRMRNSNSIDYKNHNFNLHIADLIVGDDVRIENSRQFQYYTTTSALSPAPLRNGLAFSYQASTEDLRQWHIQALDSAGRWSPLMGYGFNPFLFHLGGLCVKRSPLGDLDDDVAPVDDVDYFVASLYYNLSNEGFGSLWTQEIAKAGVNTYTTIVHNYLIVPRQVGGTKITPTVPDEDEPSPKENGQFIGKFTSPRCGLPNDLFVAYTPTSANRRIVTEGKKGIFHSRISYRPNLDPFDPLEAVSIAQQKGLRTVIADSSNAYTLVWPTPVLDWQQRTGDPIQASAPSIIDPQAPIEPGRPYAQVGTSRLYNTDRKPFDCYFTTKAPFSPNEGYNVNKEKSKVIKNTDGLTIVQDRNNLCLDLLPANVLGIAVNLTSNRADPRFNAYNAGYEAEKGKTTSPAVREVKRLLGVYDIRQQSDQSFLALIPSHAPFDFQLLDRTYGLKLTDVRSWHSLQPRETRTDCGGCHQHELGKTAYPFAGTYASTQPPLDMVNQTPRLTYDKDCNPVLTTSANATERLPEWKADIFPGFAQYCGSCHDVNQITGTPPSIQALGYTDEENLYHMLDDRNYAGAQLGALGSPVFWAARGQRTDGRLNSDPKFQKNLAVNKWGYFFTAAPHPGLCGDTVAKARWVYDLGVWIDNHMPRNTRSTSHADFDWYHPSVDLALDSEDSVCTPTRLRLGYWDDSGNVSQLTLEKNGVQVSQWNNLTNGALVYTFASSPQNGDIFRVVAQDPTQNRQIYSKSVSEMISECLLIQ